MPVIRAGPFEIQGVVLYSLDRTERAVHSIASSVMSLVLMRQLYCCYLFVIVIVVGQPFFFSIYKMCTACGSDSTLFCIRLLQLIQKLVIIQLV